MENTAIDNNKAAELNKHFNLCEHNNPIAEIDTYINFGTNKAIKININHIKNNNPFSATLHTKERIVAMGIINPEIEIK